MIRIHKVDSNLEAVLYMVVSTSDGKVKRINLSQLNKQDKTPNGIDQNFQYLILPKT